MDSIFNYVIFLIPIAILINRFVQRAKAKNAPPPPKKPKPAYVPVHFEVDSDDDDLGYFKNRAATLEAPQPQRPAPVAQRRKTQKNVAVPFAQKPEFQGGAQPPVVMTRPVTPVAQPRRDFSFNLSHLSSLKQAVIMSEVLGQPKAMRQIGEER